MELMTVSNKHVRPTNGSMVVVVASERLHRQKQNEGRICTACGARWTVQRDEDDEFHVWKNGVQTDSAILDWTGNNVAVECCRKKE